MSRFRENGNAATSTAATLEGELGLVLFITRGSDDTQLSSAFAFHPSDSLADQRFSHLPHHGAVIMQNILSSPAATVVSTSASSLLSPCHASSQASSIFSVASTTSSAITTISEAPSDPPSGFTFGRAKTAGSGMKRSWHESSVESSTDNADPGRAKKLATPSRKGKTKAVVRPPHQPGK